MDDLFMDELHFAGDEYAVKGKMFRTDDDVDMDDDDPDEDEAPKVLDDDALEDRHKETEHLCIPRPSLLTIYFNPKSALIAAVPDDLQLIVYFFIYNSIVNYNFMALKIGQSLDTCRAIWYYGVDKGHAFAMFSHHIRWNIIIMTFLWVTGFDPKYCKPGCGEFVLQFIEAWLESLVFEHETIANSFGERELFIRLWKDCPFDLYYFNFRDKQRMRGRITRLYKKLNDMPNLPSHVDFVEAVRSGKVKEELWEKHGPALALQWVCGTENWAKEKQNKIDKTNIAEQIDLNVEQAKKDLEAATTKRERMEARFAAGERMDDADVALAFESSFDPFPDDVHAGMGHVAWDDDVLEALRTPLDAEPKTTSEIEKARPEADEKSFYITREQIFDGVFALDDKADDGEGVGYDTLADLLKVTVI
jgi:hypothetical protein